MYSQQKEEEANLEGEGTLLQQQELSQNNVVLMVTSLPRKLWPHNFFILSLVSVILLFFFSWISFTVAIPAVIVAWTGCRESERGNYAGAKKRSKITVALLLVAYSLEFVVMLSLVGFFGWIGCYWILPEYRGFQCFIVGSN